MQLGSSSVDAAGSTPPDMCSSSEAGSYLRLIDFGYHLILGMRVIKKKKKVNTSSKRENPLALPE